MKKTVRTLAAVGALTLSLAACGSRDTAEDDTQDEPGAGDSSSASQSPTQAAQQYPDFKACMVSDSGGFDDKSFNQTSKAGLDTAVATYGMQEADKESNDPSEFADNINQMVRQKCNSITTVGFLLGDATEAAAKKNPKIDFSIVDYAYENPTANLKGLTFNSAEPSYLAGYLAAAESESGFVATLGGQKIPSVTSFMDGFAQGVDRWNTDNPDSPVQLLGWDRESQEGSFTNDFENKSVGQSTAEELITQGADVVFPVAGPAGLGALQAAQDEGVKAIWVDTDGCQSTEFCDVLLSSVTKGMDVAVEAAIGAAADGSFDNEVYVGTLANDGVGLAPYSDDVDSDVQDKIEELKQEIIDGTTTVEVG